MIDLHCHVLPGIDDGPQVIEGSLALARAAGANGIRTLVATPHVSQEYHNDAETIVALVAALNARLASEGIAVDVRPGAEIAAARAGQISADELQRLSLGGGQWLLVEPPFVAVVSGLDTLLLDLQSKGHRILLAHPERCPALHRDPQMLRGLVSRGVLTSITAGSLAGRFGADVRRFALALATDGLVHNVASDAHDHQRRPPSIAEELQHAGLGALSQWLTHEVPAAILDGSETIPPRPAIAIEPLGARPRSRWHSLRR